jgi:uncharacterized protein YecA (UPF0149 family)
LWVRPPPSAFTYPLVFGDYVMQTSFKMSRQEWMYINSEEGRNAEKALRMSSGKLPYVGPPKLGRNDMCICASGKKFKRCCLPKIKDGSF